MKTFSFNFSKLQKNVICFYVFSLLFFIFTIETLSQEKKEFLHGESDYNEKTKTGFLQSWSLYGNNLNAFNGESAFLGTKNNYDLRFKVNNTLAILIEKNGKVRIEKDLYVAGNIQSGKLGGTGIALLQTDNNGLINKFPFPGNAMQVLKGDGSFGYLSGMVPFDSIYISDYIKIGNTIYIGTTAPGEENSIYSTGGPLLIQSKGGNDRNTVINAFNSGFTGIGTNNPQKKLHIKEVHESSSGGITGSIRLEDEYVDLGASSVWDISPSVSNSPVFQTHLNFGPPGNTVVQFRDNGYVRIGRDDQAGRLMVKGAGVFSQAVGIKTDNPGNDYATPDRLGIDVRGDGRFGHLENNYTRIGFNGLNCIIDAYENTGNEHNKLLIT